MGRSGISISTKLIANSTLMIIAVIAVFGVMNSMRSRRIIDDATKRLQEQITEVLKRSGLTQLRLLAETTRIALVQNDYSTLQSILQNIAKQDERLMAVAVVDKSGTVLAHSDPKVVGNRAEGLLRTGLADPKPRVQVVAAQKTMVFTSAVEHEGARLFLAYSLVPLEAELAKAEKGKREELAASLRNMVVVGALSLLLGVLLTIVQGVRISRPIQAVVRQAERIAGGDLLARVEIKSHDEIGLLGDRFNYMAEQVLNLMRETMAKATMEKELEVASAIQGTLVPDSSVVKIGELQLAGFFKPATQCGGDWWNYYQLDDGRVLVIIGDVTGHGVASAMITAAAKGATTTMVAVSGRKLDLRALLRTLNIAIRDAARGRFVMTCFASIYDSRTRTLTYGNAGHNFPYLFEADSGRVLSLVVRGNRLGDIADSDYEVRETRVKPNDTMIWYTDGIVECEDVRGEEYGERRFRAAIRLHAPMVADQARDQIVERASQFYGKVPQKDDITLVIGKFT